MFPFIVLYLLLFVSYFSHWLKISGLIALFILGHILILFASPIFWGMFAFMFIISSSIKGLQNIYQMKENPYEAKSSQRDGFQLLSNSFPALIFILLGNLLTPSFPYFFAASCSLTTAFSDTLASEIGRFSKGKTYTLFGKPIEKGRSGGISVLGTFAGFLGAFGMSVGWLILSLLFQKEVSSSWLYQFLILALLGFLGMLLDSLLGLQQGLFRTSKNTLTEKKTSQIVSGKSYLSNDGVNFISQFLIGLLGLLIAFKCGWF